MHRTIILLVVLTTVAALPAQAADEMRPGQWQVTQTMEMGGQSMPPQTLTYCHKASDPKEPLPSQQLPEGCKTGEMEHSGNTVRWQFSCTGENAMQGSGEMTQHSDSYEGVMRMKTEAGAMTTHMQGKRIGDC